MAPPRSASSRRASPAGTTDASVARPRASDDSQASGSEEETSTIPVLEASARVTIDRPPAWESGMASSQRSSRKKGAFAACARALAVKQRRASCTPFGAALVPEVKSTAASCSGSAVRSRALQGVDRGAREREVVASSGSISSASGTSCRARAFSASDHLGCSGISGTPPSRHARIVQITAGVADATKRTPRPGDAPSEVRVERLSVARSAASPKLKERPSVTRNVRSACSRTVSVTLSDSTARPPRAPPSPARRALVRAAG